MKPSADFERQGDASASRPDVRVCHALPNDVGCGRTVPFPEFDLDTMTCSECAQRIAARFNVPYQQAGLAATALRNAPWYASHAGNRRNGTPSHEWLAEHDERAQVRILVLAVGGKVTAMTAAESQAAQKLRSERPEFRRIHEAPKPEAAATQHITSKETT